MKELKIFCAKACSPPTLKAAALFTNKKGIQANVDVCSGICAQPSNKNKKLNELPMDMLDEIKQSAIHDLVISGAEYLLDDAEEIGLIKKGTRNCIAYRKSALIVSKGNPKSIHTIEDLTKPDIRIGVSIIDCLKGLWEDICGRAGLIEEIRNNIKIFAHGCFAIMEAVAKGWIDVGFGWTAFKFLRPKELDIVELPRKLQIFRATSIAVLKFCKNDQLANKFIEFIKTPQIIKEYINYGWLSNF
jgi:accessory colonization factor AcfC